MHFAEFHQRIGRVHVILAVSALFDGQSAPEEFDRLGWVAERTDRVSEVIQRDGHFRVVAAVHPLLDRERALQHVSLLRVVA